MEKIQAVILDAGGVYLQGSFVDFVNKSYRVLEIKKTFSTKEEVVFDEELNKGTVSAEECFCKYFGVSMTDKQMKEILRLWKSTWSLQPEMQGLVRRLQDNYTLAILSNSDLVNSQEYSRKGWYDPFKVLVLSHEQGILKPNKRIYEITMEKLGFPAELCVFVDDQEKNLIPARELGMITILYRNLEQMIEDLRKIGVE